MTSRSTLAQIRFGTGLGVRAQAEDPDQILRRLQGRDLAADEFPMETMQTRVADALRLHELRRARHESDAAQNSFTNYRREFRNRVARQLGTRVARAIWTEDGLRERLTWFWADHFTTVPHRVQMLGRISAYVDMAIRPHVAGNFADMLEAAILNPIMIRYLDQDRSIGPNSPVGLRRGASLNENLAREVLELHSLGVGANYDQRDVRQLAELLTGLSVNTDWQMVFRAATAEPGAEQVLGVSYGGDEPAELDDLRAVLRDLALRPETGRHISWKLADYFLTDVENSGAVDAMTSAYLESGGDLSAVMAALLDRPEAWQMPFSKVKRPFHFLASATRALGLDPEEVSRAPLGVIGRVVQRPMAAMGQSWQGAQGPDGYFDDDQEWIRSQSLAARIGWAMTMPSQIVRSLPDPRQFVDTALGDAASDDLIWSVARAETREAGIGLVLSSPDFQRS